MCDANRGLWIMLVGYTYGTFGSFLNDANERNIHEPRFGPLQRPVLRMHLQDGSTKPYAASLTQQALRTI